VTPEAIRRLLVAIPGEAWRHDILRTLRMVYRFGVENRLVDENPSRRVQTRQPTRSKRMLPLTIHEVDRVAEGSGRWGPLVIFMADTAPAPARRSTSNGDTSTSTLQPSSCPARRPTSRGEPST